MGIFSVLSNMISSGGNFRFVAENMAAIYSVMRETPFGRTLDHSHLLFATALADVLAYLSTGELTQEDVERAVSSALAHSVTVNFYSKPAFSPLDSDGFDENLDLICLTMQIEAMVFTLSTRIDYHTVVDQVIAHKMDIGKTINKSLANIKRLKIYDAVYGNVTVWAANPDFQNAVLAYEGIETDDALS